MYKYSVDSRRVIFFILINPFFWASMTLCEQLRSAPLGLQASAQGDDPFLHLYPFIERFPVAAHQCLEEAQRWKQIKGKERRKPLF